MELLSSFMLRTCDNPRVCATTRLLRARESGLSAVDISSELTDIGAAAKRGEVGADKESRRYWSVMLPLLAKVRAEFERQRSAFAGSAAAVEGLEKIAPFTLHWGVTAQDVSPSNTDSRFDGPSMVFADSTLRCLIASASVM
jgi:hypothetical protein